MTERAIELLCLPEDKSCFVLDIGCGSGLSGDVLEEHGHMWAGCDISPSMLQVATEDQQVEGDLFLQDAGQGVGYRPGTFDGCISISCIQWLCNADTKSHVPRQRLIRFFSTLYAALAHGARAVLQFYPENSDQIELITSSAMQSGFTGGLVVDYPNSTKRKKYFLCLFVGSSGERHRAPQPLTDENEDDPRHPRQVNVKDNKRQSQWRNKKSNGKRQNVKDKEWVTKKKETARKRGEQVANDSKYTARKRRPKF